MSRKSKVGVEDKVKAVKECMSGKCSAENAAQQLGVSKTSVLNWISLYSSEGIDGLLPRTTNRIYSPELKERAVKDYLSGEGSLRQICKKYKIRDRKELRGWIKVYNGHKDFREHTGGCRMTKARKTTIEERITIARDCIASGRNYGEMAIKYNVSYQQVYNWTNKFAEQGDAGLEDRRGQRKAQQAPRTAEEELKIRIAQLEHELYMAKMECDLLKKLDEIERRRG